MFYLILEMLLHSRSILLILYCIGLYLSNWLLIPGRLLKTIWSITWEGISWVRRISSKYQCPDQRLRAIPGFLGAHCFRTEVAQMNFDFLTLKNLYVSYNLLLCSGKLIPRFSIEYQLVVFFRKRWILLGRNQENGISCGFR